MLYLVFHQRESCENPNFLSRVEIGYKIYFVNTERDKWLTKPNLSNSYFANYRKMSDFNYFWFCTLFYFPVNLLTRNWNSDFSKIVSPWIIVDYFPVFTKFRDFRLSLTRVLRSNYMTGSFETEWHALYCDRGSTLAICHELPSTKRVCLCLSTSRAKRVSKNQRSSSQIRGFGAVRFSIHRFVLATLLCAIQSSVTSDDILLRPNRCRDLAFVWRQFGVSFRHLGAFVLESSLYMCRNSKNVGEHCRRPRIHFGNSWPLFCINCPNKSVECCDFCRHKWLLSLRSRGELYQRYSVRDA